MSLGVLIPDVHLEPLEEFDPSYLVVKRFIKDMQPDWAVILGDFGNFQCFNHHEIRKTLLMENVRYESTIALMKRELDFFQSHVRDLFYCIGNHEKWVLDYVECTPEMAGFVDLEANLDLDGRGITWCSRDEILSLGRMNFTHGWKVNKFHAEAMSREVGDHIFYGHTHDYQAYTAHFRKDQLPYLSMSCGCLCSKNPSYMQRTGASRWMNGFVVVDVQPNGMFMPHWTPILDGEFCFLGRTWRA